MPTVRNVPCEYCGKSFSKQGLPGHVRFKHTNQGQDIAPVIQPGPTQAVPASPTMKTMPIIQSIMQEPTGNTPTDAAFDKEMLRLLKIVTIRNLGSMSGANDGQENKHDADFWRQKFEEAKINEVKAELNYMKTNLQNQSYPRPQPDGGGVNEKIMIMLMQDLIGRSQKDPALKISDYFNDISKIMEFSEKMKGGAERETPISESIGNMLSGALNSKFAESLGSSLGSGLGSKLQNHTVSDLR